MKNTFLSHIKDLIAEVKRFLKLQTDCVRLLVAEKLTILLSALILAIIGVILGAFIIVLLAMAGVSALSEFMSPGLAYLCMAGVVSFLLVIVLLLRKYIVVNPLAKLISKIIYPKLPQ